MKRFNLQAALILIATLLLATFLQYQLVQHHRGNLTLTVSSQLATLRARIEKEIVSNLLLIQGTAHFISLNPDLSGQTFDRYAQEVMRSPHLLRNLGAAPDFVMTHVYPLETNQAVLGMDYRKVPEQWAQAQLAMETGQMTVAGPLSLRQGGLGLIGRAPVYAREAQGERFWGLVSAVMDMDRLFKQVGLGDFTDLRLAIRGTDGKGSEGAVFLGDAALFTPDQQAVLMPVHFPAGSWQLAAVPRAGWFSLPPSLILMELLLGLLLLGIGLSVYMALRKAHELARVQASLSEAQAIAHLGNWELDLVRDTLWWSDETYRIFGVDKTRFTPTREAFMALVHPADRARIEEIHTCSGGGEPYTLEYRILRPDGALRHIQGQGITECDAHRRPRRAVGTLLDITERTHAEEALREVRERYEHITEKLKDRMVFFVHTLEGELLYLSQGCEILGQAGAPHDYLGRHWTEVAHWTPESLARAAEQDRRLIAGETDSADLEASFLAPDGTPRHLAIYQYSIFNPARNEPVIEGLAVDITTQKTAESRLRVLSRAIQNAPASVVITDIDGNIIYVNPYFCQATGYSRDEVLGRNPRILKSGRHDESFYLSMWHTLERGETWHGEMINRRKDGGLFWESVSISCVYDESGNRSNYVAVKEDISDRKNLERMKEEVDRIMRHDLKGPLNALVGLPPLIEMEGDLNEDQREMLKLIEDASQNMLSMINLSLDMFKIETGAYRYRPTQVDALAVVGRIVGRSQANLLDKGLLTRIQVDGQPARAGQSLFIWSEATLLSSMLSNLFINAIEASPHQATIHIDFERDATHQRISLRNQGTVPLAIREHFFDKYSTHGKQYGTGLGTYSARMIAKAMGYDIRMHTSDETDSTSLCIQIPLVRPDDPTAD